MGQEGEFHTLTGYRQLEGGEITEAMEDYLEMLTRHMMEKGYLLWRHEVLNRFFCWLNGSENQLRQVERVEHFMEPETLRRLEALMEHLGVSEPAEPRDPSVSFP